MARKTTFGTAIKGGTPAAIQQSQAANVIKRAFASECHHTPRVTGSAAKLGRLGKTGLTGERNQRLLTEESREY